MLSTVTLDFGSLPSQITKRAVGAINVANIGWYTWNFGSHESKIYPINFAQSILFCPYPNATGINIYMSSAIPYTYRLYGKDGSGLGTQLGGNILNLASGVLASFGQPSVFHGESTTTEVQPHAQIGYGAGPRTIGQTPVLRGNGAEGTANVKHSQYRAYLILLQMACEIAQWTIMADDNTTTQTFTNLSGFTQLLVPTGTARQLDLDLTATPHYSSQKFGSTGLYKVGYVSWEYNGFYAPVEYVNQVSQKFFPPAPGATGVATWITKPAVATATLGYLTDLQEAMSTTLGEVGLMSGKVAGIL